MSKKIIIIITSIFSTLFIALAIIALTIYIIYKYVPHYKPQIDFYSSGKYKISKVLNYNNQVQKDLSNIYLDYLSNDSEIDYEIFKKMDLNKKNLTINYTNNGNNLISVTNEKNELVGYVDSYSKYIVMYIKNKNNELFKIFFKYVE